ncbi:MAG: insulinase family protein, partial [Roseburia sp.]|nr:insulinase family protein [Roseburia sp.]
NAKPRRVSAVLERYFGEFPASTTNNKRRQPLLLPPFDISRNNGLHQCHTIWGLRIPSIFSPDSIIFSLLSNLLAGPGMNSLLNVELRERRGLVYTVESSTVNYTDCGVLTIYYGCDTESSRRCRDVMRRSLSYVASQKITRRRFEEAKHQYIGQLTVARENNEQRALSAGRRMMYFNEVASSERRRKDIADITYERFSEVASTLSPDNFSILTLT